MKSVSRTKAEVTEIEELTSSHEEAATCVFIHARHAAHSTQSFPKVTIISEDIDVFVIFLEIHVLGKDVCSVLIGLHVWTGCDTLVPLLDRKKSKS